MHLPYDPTIPLLVIYLRAYVRSKTCAQMFIKDIIVIAKNWKQPRSSSMCKWMNKLIYQTMQYDSAIERNELLIHTTNMDESQNN